MDLLKSEIKPMFFKYFSAAFGGAFITAIYSIVDMAMVGQYHGPNGSAAMSVVMPVFNIIYSLGMFTGIGGAILFSSEKGKANHQDENMFFSASLIITIIFALAAWSIIVIFEDPLMRIFGAEETILPLTKGYLSSIKYVIPIFVFNQMLSAFLRNDNAPGLATTSVLIGGIFNVFGDYFLVFTLDMGIKGAGLATAIGTCITFVIMLFHFASKNNTLRFVRVKELASKAKQILMTGFSPFFIDLSVGSTTTMFNIQIVRYLGTNALAVYGIIGQISMFVQCCAYSVGQASQPILSINYGAKQVERIEETLKYALIMVAIFSFIWVVLMMLFPNGFVSIFMKPTEEVLKIAPRIMRIYGSSFLLLPLNIFSTYYFQSLMKSKVSFYISFCRGLVVSGILIIVLPIINPNALWFSMPITEVLVSSYVVTMMVKYTKELSI